MADFNISYKRLEKWEGGYSNVISDKGGETYKGISRVYFPDNLIWSKIDRLKKEGLTGKQITELLEKETNVKDAVKTFYRAEFWNRLRLGEIENQDFACNIFLLAVNAGLKRGIKTGQEACGILVDGVLGPQTLAAFKKASNKEVERYTEIEIKYYEDRADKDESQRKFLNGWTKRAKEV